MATAKPIVPGGAPSLAKVLKELQEQGYSEDFNIKDVRKKYFGTQGYDNFQIDKVLRMDVMADPDDQSVVYALSSKDGNVKGVLVNSYGLYSDSKLDEIIDHIERPIDRNRHDHVDYV